VDVKKLPKHLQDQVWKPNEDDVGIKEIMVDRTDGFEGGEDS
jgi:hypothetical protein